MVHSVYTLIQVYLQQQKNLNVNSNWFVFKRASYSQGVSNSWTDTPYKGNELRNMYVAMFFLLPTIFVTYRHNRVIRRQSTKHKCPYFTPAILGSAHDWRSILNVVPDRQRSLYCKCTKIRPCHISCLWMWPSDHELTTFEGSLQSLHQVQESTHNWLDTEVIRALTNKTLNMQIKGRQIAHTRETVCNYTNHEHVIKEEHFSLVLARLLLATDILHFIQPTVTDQTPVKQCQLLIYHTHACTADEFHTQHNITYSFNRGRQMQPYKIN